ncbi:MAG: DUF4956 domain-containing protein [Caldithrix sp.]|nr:MAG: DUF4956 domain-containing protein [Caldithrix sp.]
MLQEFQNILRLNITLAEIIGNLLIAFLCGLAISWLYRKLYRGPGYSVAFVNGLIILAMITAVVIMVIGNNLARAFGLVGAMSIIRFRTAVKDTQDIIFIFFALTIGMAAGVGIHKLAIVGTLFVGAVFYVLNKTNMVAPQQKEFLLQFNVSANGQSEDAAYLPVLKQYCRHSKLINVKTISMDDSLELSYYVKLKDENKNADLVREIKTVSGVKQVNLFYDDEQF